MQVTVPLARTATPPVNLARRMGPIALGAGLVGSAAILSANNPSAGGLHFPTCAFHQATGLWCPACGLTRGTYQLLHGHVAAALSYNIFTPVVLVGILVAWCAWLPVSWGRGTAGPTSSPPPWPHVDRSRGAHRLRGPAKHPGRASASPGPVAHIHPLPPSARRPYWQRAAPGSRSAGSRMGHRRRPADVPPLVRG